MMIGILHISVSYRYGRTPDLPRSTGCARIVGHFIPCCGGVSVPEVQCYLGRNDLWDTIMYTSPNLSRLRLLYVSSRICDIYIIAVRESPNPFCILFPPPSMVFVSLNVKVR